MKKTVEQIIEEVKNNEEVINEANTIVEAIENVYQEAIEDAGYITEDTEVIDAENYILDFLEIVQEVADVDLEDVVFDDDFIDDYEVDGNIDDAQKLAVYILSQVVDCDLLDNAHYCAGVIVYPRDEDERTMENYLDEVKDNKDILEEIKHIAELANEKYDEVIDSDEYDWDDNSADNYMFELDEEFEKLQEMLEEALGIDIEDVISSDQFINDDTIEFGISSPCEFAAYFAINLTEDKLLREAHLYEDTVCFYPTIRE